MDKNDYIRQLVNRYYEGGTTRAEEAELRAYLSLAKDLPEDLEEERRFLMLLDEDVEADLPAGLTERWEKEIDAAASRERYGLWRLRIIQGVAAAACLTVGWNAWQVFTPRHDSNSKQTEMQAVIQKETEAVSTPAATSEEPAAPIAQAPTCRKTSVKARTSENTTRRETTEPEPESIEEFEIIPADEPIDPARYLPEWFSDPEMLAELPTEGTYIIPNEEDARNIMAAVFGDVSEALTIGSSRAINVAAAIYTIKSDALYGN